MPARLRLMGFDVDGVLTDGSLLYGDTGGEIKAFNVRDGLGMKWLMEAGIRVAIITGRRSLLVEHRCRDLGIALFAQGVDDKLAQMRSFADKLGLGLDQCGYMGDDVVDLPILMGCGFSATPADGDVRVQQRAGLITHATGGKGAVREVCEHILAAQGTLPTLLRRYGP